MGVPADQDLSACEGGAAPPVVGTLSLVPILHSLHAMYGAFYAMKLLASSSSVRPKTER